MCTPASLNVVNYYIHQLNSCILSSCALYYAVSILLRLTNTVYITAHLALITLQANKVDAFMHRQLTQYDQSAQYSTSLGTWVLYHTLNVMIHYTLAGFELELYAIHEYHYVYW